MSCLWFQVAGRVCEPHWGTKTAGWKNSKKGGEVGAAMSPWSQGVCPQGPRPAEEQSSQWLLRFALILTICGAMCYFTINHITRAYKCTPFNLHFLVMLVSKVAFQHFQELDDHISYVATKVCHLGDQLEGVNTPRQRAVEAQRLMTYFNEFLDGELRSDVFYNPDKVRFTKRTTFKPQMMQMTTITCRAIFS